MIRLSGALALIVMMCGLAFGQPAQTPAAFEAADVHSSPAGTTQSGGFLPDGRVEFRGMTLFRLILIAHGVQADRVTGGPSWLDTDRFDLVAKAAGSPSAIKLRTMMQNLLAERFGLSIQSQDKPQPVYALTVAKRGKLKESSGSAEPGCKSGFEDGQLSYSCTKTTIPELVEALVGVAPSYFNHPLMDRTGLTGTYDFTLKWMPRGQLGPGPEGSKGSIYNSLEQQLGIKVETQTAPLPVLAIERVNRTPSPNPAGVLEKLGPAPTEFDVATVRPSRPDETEDFVIKGGRIDAKGISMKDLIAFAYNVEDDWVISEEKWLASERFTISAKTAPTASADTLRTLLQALLVERFRLKVHKEARPVSVYALTAGKQRSKLKDADGSALATCKIGVGNGGRTYTCTNTTMAQFAEKIRTVAAAYLDHVVVDLTGLPGAYDFALTWAPKGKLMRNPPSPATEGGAPGPVGDPVAGFTVFEAVDRYLGLKLAAQKHPMPVVVVDHVDRKPAEN